MLFPHLLVLNTTGGERLIAVWTGQHANHLPAIGCIYPSSRSRLDLHPPPSRSSQALPFPLPQFLQGPAQTGHSPPISERIALHQSAYPKRKIAFCPLSHSRSQPPKLLLYTSHPPIIILNITGSPSGPLTSMAFRFGPMYWASSESILPRSSRLALGSWAISAIPLKGQQSILARMAATSRETLLGVPF